MNTLYIRLPAKTIADKSPDWLALACPFALVSQSGVIEREGAAPLSSLSDAIAKTQRVVMVLAGSDVTVLRLKIPPLSAAKLKAALPNLVEEQLLCDPLDCVIVAGDSQDGLRTIAVAQRTWLDLLAKALFSFGARHISALPASVCLPLHSGDSGQPGIAAAATDQRDNSIDLTLRLSAQHGMGITIGVEPDKSACRQVIQTLCAVSSTAPITLYVPQSLVQTYQGAVNETVGLGKRINLSTDNWSRWIAGANSTTIDLMAALGSRNNPELNWRPWRWPLALAVVVLVVNATALNIDWWRMKSESSALRTTMIHIYKSAYPNELVIIDPVAQMQQKIAAAKHASGHAAADDFTAITAVFGKVWANVTPSLANRPSIAALEYRERRLLVRLKSGDQALTQPMQAALAERGLSLELLSGQPSVVWQIRGAK